MKKISFCGIIKKENKIFGVLMTELETIFSELKEKLGLKLDFYAENTRPAGKRVCEKQFELVTDDGSSTYFRFLYKNVGYIGSVMGAGETERNYALLLPSYIESFMEKGAELSKTDTLKRILKGECSSMAIYKYTTRYSVRGKMCFAIVLRVPKLMDETIAVLEQYGGNSLDTVVKMDDTYCVLVKFLGDEENEYRSTVDYAEFVTQSLQEELGVEARAGVGTTVRELKDISLSYMRAENALRYADMFELSGKVHAYREFLLVKMLEDLPEGKLEQYLGELTDDKVKDILDDEEMVSTAEAFLQSSLNVSETSRNLYMHRNTLLYRLDKIEKATGLNIRLFGDAVSFRVLTMLYRLLEK